MNARKLIAAVAVLAAANTAFAAEWVEFTNVESTRTRAEVMAELKQSQADGSYAIARQEYEGQLPALKTNAADTRLAGQVRTAGAN